MTRSFEVGNTNGFDCITAFTHAAEFSAIRDHGLRSSDAFVSYRKAMVRCGSEALFLG